MITNKQVSLLGRLEDFIQSLDEFSENVVEYSCERGKRSTVYYILINGNNIKLSKVGKTYSLIFNEEVEFISKDDYDEWAERFDQGISAEEEAKIYREILNKH